MAADGGRLFNQIDFEPRRAKIQRRLNAAYALKNLGQGGKAAVPALIEALNSDAPIPRSIAAEVLGAIGPAAIPAIAEVLKRLDTIEATAEPEYNVDIFR